MTGAVPGDPASCSQLGGALRSAAARLLAARGAVGESLTSTAMDPSHQALAERVRRDVRLLDLLAEQLDAAGAVLQLYAQELAQLAESARQLEAAASRAGLALDGLRVVEPWGVASAEVASRRQRALPELQMRADRLASQLGRAGAAVHRSMTRSSQLLGGAATAARGSLGG